MTVQQYFDFIFSTELLLACLVAFMVFITGMKVIKQKNQPPCLGYWRPWIGCAVEFGREPLYFIEKARRKVGNFRLPRR